MKSSITRNGMTLIETLVSIGIISIVAALLVPAVQAARESARRAQCANNLKQLALATHAYHGVHNMFPPPITNSRFGKPRYMGLFSVQTRLLPFLEQRPLYDAINFSVGTAPLETPNEHSPLEQDMFSIMINSTAFNTRIAQFLCPSDGESTSGACCSYRGNTGVGWFVAVGAEMPDSANGLFPEMNRVNIAGVTDGLSNTVAFSERSLGSNVNQRPDPSRDFYFMPSMVQSADQLVLSCRLAAHPGAGGFTYGGRWWFWSGRERTLYNHAQGPNGRVPDCLFPSMIGAAGMATARSQHCGGVNMSMGDGAVRYVSESVDLNVWRALGSRNGREVVD